MRHLVIVLALAGCTETVEERVERFEDENDIDCWSYFCPGRELAPVTTPVEERVSCMNDALTLGKRAKVSWTIERNDAYTYDGVRVFTVDNQIKVFTVHGFADDPPEFTEQPTCGGPFRAGPVVCTTLTGSQPVNITALAWDCR